MRISPASLALAAVLAPAAFWLGRTTLETALLIGVLLLVFIVELFNSAIEAAILFGERLAVTSVIGLVIAAGGVALATRT